VTLTGVILKEASIQGRAIVAGLPFVPISDPSEIITASILFHKVDA